MKKSCFRGGRGRYLHFRLWIKCPIPEHADVYFEGSGEGRSWDNTRTRSPNIDIKMKRPFVHDEKTEVTAIHTAKNPRHVQSSPVFEVYRMLHGALSHASNSTPLAQTPTRGERRAGMREAPEKRMYCTCVCENEKDGGGA